MNKAENIVNYPDIGDVRYMKSFRARNLSIRINQQGEVRVAVPRHLSFRKAESFLVSKRMWIKVKLTELNRISEAGRILKHGDILYVRGEAIPLRLKGDTEEVEEAIWRILLDAAKGYLPGRVHELANQYGFKIAGVKVRRMKTRWGSCTARNAINLNSWLVMLPDTLIDYVILHELVHTRHKNHSAVFWESLDNITGGNSKNLRKELRSQRIMYFQ